MIFVCESFGQKPSGGILLWWACGLKNLIESCVWEKWKLVTVFTSGLCILQDRKYHESIKWLNIYLI